MVQAPSKTEPPVQPSLQQPIQEKWFLEARQLTTQGESKKVRELLVESNIEPLLERLEGSQRYEACHNIALMLHWIRSNHQALKYCQKALDIEQAPETYNLEGLIYRGLDRHLLSLDMLNKARELDPENILILNNIALGLIKFKQDEAVDLLRDIIQMNSGHIKIYSNLLLFQNYLPMITAQQHFEDAKAWANVHAPAHLACSNHDNTLDINRKLRIGYISPDFRDHPVMYFFNSLLTGHDRTRFEIYGYGNVACSDRVTEAAIPKFDHYHNIASVTAADTASLIQSDNIDILVDLAGHTQEHRLDVLVLKPAPIQVTYCGYPNTTGMPQIDYRLTDAIVDPPGHQKYYTEKLIHLPNGFLSYDPFDAQPVVTAPPVFTNGHITFGSFNNISKITPQVMKLWIQVLKCVEKSRLLMKFQEAGDPGFRDLYWDKFEKLGLADARKRIIFSKALPFTKHLELYNGIDIALDTFPYNGTTTTFQAMLMGVPIVTLFGDCHASRVGLDILSRLDMTFFATETEEEYVKKAVALAMKPEALIKIRESMRKRLASSPMCNPKVITGDIENAYRQMWQTYCQSQKKKNTTQDFPELETTPAMTCS